MKTIFDVPADRLIAKAADRLKDLPEIKAPAWVAVAKSGAHNERAPEQPNFWYLRSASLLRQVYMNGPIGVGEFRRHYGGAKRHVVTRQHKMKAGGSIIRKALQQLEKAGLVETKRMQGRAIGRIITGKGKALLDGAAREVKV